MTISVSLKLVKNKDMNLAVYTYNPNNREVKAGKKKKVEYHPQLHPI